MRKLPVQIRKVIYPCILSTSMDNEVGWFSASSSPWHLWNKILGLVVIAEVSTSLRFYFVFISSWGRTAMEFTADVARGQIKYLLNLFFSITKRHLESIGFRVHWMESLKFLLWPLALPYVGATWLCGNCYFWSNTKTDQNYPKPA